MPNWVQHNMTVNGQMDDVLKFIQQCHSKNSVGEQRMLDFNSFIPCPYELLSVNKEWHGDAGIVVQAATDTDMHIEQKAYADNQESLIKKYGHGNWYDWCVANWNTKWNACSVQPVDLNISDEKKSSAIFIFDTAWDSPIPVFIKMTEMNPAIILTVWACEESQEFQWVKKWHNGELVSEEHIPFEEEGISQ